MKYLFKMGVLALSSSALGLALSAQAADLEQGKQLFASDAQPMACAICHTLEDAGATGNIGPDLDDLQPDADRIRKVMIEGMGAMPSFSDSLDDDERESIVEYVISVTQ